MLFASGDGRKKRLRVGVQGVDTDASVASRVVRWLHQFPVTSIREMKILKFLKHPNVVALKEIVSSSGRSQLSLVSSPQAVGLCWLLPSVL